MTAIVASRASATARSQRRRQPPRPGRSPTRPAASRQPQPARRTEASQAAPLAQPPATRPLRRQTSRAPERRSPRRSTTTGTATCSSATTSSATSPWPATAAAISCSGQKTPTATPPTTPTTPSRTCRSPRQHPTPPTPAPAPEGAGTAPRPVTALRYDETKIGPSSTAGDPLHGLQASYYENSDLAGRPALRTTDSTVDFNWSTGGPTEITATNEFSARWTGTITLPSTGNYTFSTVSDEGTRLVINGIALIDNWHNQTVTTNSAPATSFTAGTYKISLAYYEATGPAEVHLRWSCSTCSPAISDQIIPSSALQPAWNNQTSVVSPLGRIAFNHFAQPETGQHDYSLVKLASGTNLITSYSYDSFGRITQKVMPKGNSSATIASNGDLSGTPNTDYVTTWTYNTSVESAAPPSTCGGGSAVNQAGLLKQNAVHGLANQTYIYDSAGRLIAETKGAGTTCYAYDAEGRLLSEKAPGDTQSTTYTYDPAVRQLSATDAAGTLSSAYDEAGRPKDVVVSFGSEPAQGY